jgi:hypothetical protein
MNWNLLALHAFSCKVVFSSSSFPRRDGPLKSLHFFNFRHIFSVWFHWTRLYRGYSAEHYFSSSSDKCFKIFSNHCKYLYTLKQWFPLSATTIFPSLQSARPCGPYKGHPTVFTNAKNDPWLSKIWIRELPQSATTILSWASTATPVGALNCPLPSPLEPKQNRNSPWESKTWNNNDKKCYF